MRLPWNDTGDAPERQRADAEIERRGGSAGRRGVDWERVTEFGPAFGRIPAGVLVGASFAGGLALGAAVWDRLMEGGRRGLFSAHPMSRYHAVSYLAARPSVDTARLLRDYVRWETHPLLRRRARRVLLAVEASL